MSEKTIAVTLVAVALLASLLIVDKAVNQSEKNECNQWRKYSETIPGFYLNQSQSAQCKFLNIKIK